MGAYLIGGRAERATLPVTPRPRQARRSKSRLSARCRAPLRLDWTGFSTVWEAMLTAAILVRDMPGFSADAQRTSAAAFAAKRGLSVSRVYADDGRCHRSARQALLHEAGSAVRVVLVASTAALGRTLSDRKSVV